MPALQGLNAHLSLGDSTQSSAPLENSAPLCLRSELSISILTSNAGLYIGLDIRGHPTARVQGRRGHSEQSSSAEQPVGENN